MEIVGKSLLQPEAGWKRYDDTDPSIEYSGSPKWGAFSASGMYNGTFHQVNDNLINDSYVQFNFTGSKFRFISYIYPAYPIGTTTISIDGKTYPFEINGQAVYQAIVFEITGLSQGGHSVVIRQAANTYGSLVIDAFDIDEDGELMPYSPVEPTDPVDPTDPIEPTGQALLRVTMIDSSEREYRVSKKDVDSFVAWMDRPVNTGTTVYSLDKIMTDSKEYLLFDKIISFDVKELK